MEEVVGYLFNLEVKPVAQTPQVGLITTDSGEAVTVGKLTGSEQAEAEAAPVPPAEPEQKPEVHAPLAKGLERKAEARLSYSAPDESGEAQRVGGEPAKAEEKIGRNQPCPCGSGKKYKVCHGRPGAN